MHNRFCTEIQRRLYDGEVLAFEIEADKDGLLVRNADAGP